NSSHGGFILTPLYDLSLLPDAAPNGLRRFSDRELDLGGDAWGTSDSYDFLARHTEIHFNDLSLEHGGLFPPPPAKNPHDSHQMGTSMDVRYFGAGGAENGLNTNANGARATAWTAAKTNATARATMVAWILANRQKMDSLYDEGGIKAFWTGIEKWHW